MISVIAQNVLFRLTRAKGMTPNRPPRKHFQEEFNGPDQGSPPEKPPQSHHPPRKFRALLSQQHPQLAKRCRPQHPARHAETTPSRREQVTVIGG